MRKSYDIRRIENRELKLQEEREQLKLRIKMIHRELIILSKQI
jgi:predicted HTH domain antitoxin